jgi:hypothetical protein
VHDLRAQLDRRLTRDARGEDPAAVAVTRLEDGDGRPSTRELTGARESRDPRADDDDIY